MGSPKGVLEGYIWVGGSTFYSLLLEYSRTPVSVGNRFQTPPDRFLKLQIVANPIKYQTPFKKRRREGQEEEGNVHVHFRLGCSNGNDG